MPLLSSLPQDFGSRRNEDVLPVMGVDVVRYQAITGPAKAPFKRLMSSVSMTLPSKTTYFARRRN